MGKYKDENGITRLQALIDKAKRLGEHLPPEVVKLAGIVSPRLGQVLEAFQALVNDEKVSPMTKEQLLDAFEYAIEELENVSDRHRIDMNADSWLSKNIRPITLLTLLPFCMYLTVAEAMSKIEVQPEVIENWNTILGQAIIFYFGGREVFKWIREVKQIKRPTLFRRNNRREE